MLFKSSTKSPRAIPCKILVSTHNPDIDQEDFPSESDARETLKPVFVQGYIPVDKIEAFYASHDYPYQTIVHSGGTCVYIKCEVEEFRKQYEDYLSR